MGAIRGEQERVPSPCLHRLLLRASPYLLLCALHDAVLSGAARDEAINVYRLLLAEAVHARHGLQVHLRVPVGVEENARVGRLQVDAEAARARGHEEDEDVGVGGVECL